MTVNFSEAVAAYNRAVRQQGGPSLDSRDGPERTDFVDVLRDAAQGALQSLKAGEEQTLRAAAGDADVSEVVMAVTQAEMTLETVVTLRDRVIQAYQDVINMPI